jgi:hypothetical protein
MRSDLFLFAGILVFLFVVWVATGGPSRPLSFSGPSIAPTTGIGGSISKGPSSSGNTASAQQTQASLSRAQTDIVSLEKAIVTSARFGTPSPDEGLITISHYTSALGNDDADKEYVTIYVSTRAPKTGIDVTGWRLYSEAVGYSSRIPSGVNLFRSGSVNDAGDIILYPGQTAILTTGESPVGYSFRTNMCTGYLGQFQDFTPSLTRSCPTPINDFNRFYLGNTHSLDACEAYVKTIRQCTVPLDPPGGLGSDCNQFVETLNYNGCIDAHQGDKNFFGTQWRIFFNRDDPFFTHDHDTIKLLDQNGLTVDLLSY